VVNKMTPEMKELVIKYEPEVLWVDSDWEPYPPYWGSQEFLAWMYNESPTKVTIVTNDRWGIGTAQTHRDFVSGPDRFNPGVLQPHKWESAISVDGA
jgi:alpha-L-fucosidase